VNAAEIPRKALTASTWIGVLTRAELLERGWEASAIEGIAAALVRLNPELWKPPLVIVAEAETVSGRDLAALRWLRAIHSVVAAIAIVAVRAEAAGAEAWSMVLHRPIAVSEILGAIFRASRQAAALPPDGRVLLDGLDCRLGEPWPMIRCTRCGASRHCEQPRTEGHPGDMTIAIVTFALAHGVCKP
jgi:hypothetical protein